MAWTSAFINLCDLTIRMSHACLGFFHSFYVKRISSGVSESLGFCILGTKGTFCQVGYVPRSGNNRACFAVFNVSGRHIPVSQNTKTLCAGSSPNALLVN
jgi:hypothetical protein